MNKLCIRQQSNTALQRTEQRLSVNVRVCLPPLSFIVSRISGEGAGLGGMNGCALTWVLATVASAGR
jgi:hypothetical protein